MNWKRPRRLDLNAPLISTRRSTTTSILEKSRRDSLEDSCDRVPFSWEQSPGKPKESIRRLSDSIEVKALPIPKPPPIRWQEETTLTYNRGYVVANDHYNHDDDNNNDDNDDCFSDVMDSFSLAESPWDDLDLGDDNNIGGANNYYGSSSPNFMMQRFLPAATALAASSLSSLAVDDDDLIFSTNYNNNYNYRTERISCVSGVGEQAYSCSSKGCGLQVFLPWRSKHRICGVKSPVRRVRSTLKHQLSSMNN